MNNQTTLFDSHGNGLFNPESARGISQSVLHEGIITLNPEKPYTWASGLLAPIYADHRKTLSNWELRAMLMVLFSNLIKEKFGTVNLIAGVATAGIPHATLVAQDLKRPLCYVRSSPKGHGLGNLIEGSYKPGQKAFVIEDLLSTGKSSLAVVEALRREGIEVLGLGALFSYGFPKTHEAFRAANCPYYVLNDYPTLQKVALKEGYIREAHLPILEEWYKDPQAWSDARKQ